MTATKRITSKAIRISKDEYLVHVKYSRNKKSGMAHHVLISGHVYKRLFRQVRHLMDKKYLDAYESLEAIEGDNLKNSDRGPIPFVCLCRLLKYQMNIICEHLS